MLKTIILAALQRRVLVLALGLGLFFWGLYELQRSQVDIFPDLTAPTVTILTEADGMTPLEVEQLITVPVESALNGLNGLRRIRSNSSAEVSTVYAEFEWGTDIYLARQLVNEKLQRVQNRLPDQAGVPELAPVSSFLGEFMFVAVHSDRHDQMAVKTAADWTVRQRLLAISGMADVVSIGGETKQFQVLLKQEKLAAYGLSASEVLKAIRASSQNSAAGFMVRNDQEHLLRGVGRIESVEDIALSVVALRGDQPVLVKDVAQVEVAPAIRRGVGAFNGREAVVLTLLKQPEANTLALTREVDRRLEAIEQGLPEGMQIESDLFRQADFIETAIDNLLAALRDGAILVVVIVSLFLLNMRASLITLSAIPLSLLMTVFLLNLLDISIDTMTLGGMAIALGVLVDDAIIVVENIIRRLQMNPPPDFTTRLKRIAEAVFEIQSSIVFATLVILLVFVPLFFLEGVEGRLLMPLGLAYMIALAASLLVAITLTPVLSHYFLRFRDKSAHDAPLIRALERAYERLLRGVLYRWKMIATASALAFLVSLWALLGAGKTFLPEFNEGSLTVTIVALPATALQTSSEIAAEVERVLLSFDEVKNTARRTGRGELDSHSLGVHVSEIEVALKMGKRSKEDFLAALRGALSEVGGVNISIGQPISHRIDHMLSGTRAAIAIKVFGEDIYQLRRLAESMKGVVESVEGAVDVMIEEQSDVPQILLKMKRDAMAVHGLRADELAEMIQTAFYGTPAATVYEGNALREVVVRYKHSSALDLEKIAASLAVTPTGAQLPLGHFVQIEKRRAPSQVSRENAVRKVTLMANTAGGDLVGIVEEIRAKVENSLTLPDGYYVTYGGQFESAQRSTKRLLAVSAAVFVVVVLLLYRVFGSFRDALLVLVNLPLALIGGVAGLYFSGGVVSIATLIGFITLFGVATRNGVMLVAHIQRLIDAREVQHFKEAVIRGAKERLVPIMMTALATGFAMIPLALSAGEAGSEIQAPMAVVIFFGLLSSTILNMIVLPALYFRFGAHKKRCRG
jgi:CzcA family heavy metal efflux pump